MSCGARTFGAGLAALAPGTSPTFAIAELDGSATKKIRLLRIAVGGTELTALAVNNLRLTKLSSISTGGVATIATVVPFDSANAGLATGVFRGFTTAPTGGGTIIGAITSYKLVTDLVTLNPIATVTFDFSTLPPASRPTLTTAAQAFALDFNGATPANAPNLDVYAWWTEEPLNA